MAQDSEGAEIKYKRTETFAMNLGPGMLTLQRDHEGCWSLSLWEGHSEYEGKAAVDVPSDKLRAIGEMFTDAWLRGIGA